MCRFHEDLKNRENSTIYQLILPKHTTGAPTDAGYATIFSTASAFAALREDGSIEAWGSSWGGGTGKYAYMGLGVHTNPHHAIV